VGHRKRGRKGNSQNRLRRRKKPRRRVAQEREEKYCARYTGGSNLIPEGDRVLYLKN